MRRAIEKYGLDAFEKTVLFVFDNTEEMFEKEAERRYSKCRDCSQPILWFKTRNDKNVPVDVDSVDEADYFDNDNKLLDKSVHVVHWDSCSNNPRKK